MIERIDPDLVFGFDSEADRQRYVENDFRIRSGLCPNGHGLMREVDGCQQCESCGFFTNVKAERPPKES